MRRGFGLVMLVALIACGREEGNRQDPSYRAPNTVAPTPPEDREDRNLPPPSAEGEEGEEGEEAVVPVAQTPRQDEERSTSERYASSPGLAIYEDGVRANAMGDVEQAITLLRQSVEVDPELVPGWQAWFDIDRERGEHAGAAEACAGLLTHGTFSGHAAAELHLQCAVANRAAGRLADAEHWAWEAHSQGGGRLETLITLTGILVEAGRPLEALPLLEAGIRADSRGSLEASALSNLGAAYVALERFDEGIAAYQRALGMEPRRTDIMLNLGSAQRQAGHVDEARQTYQGILALDPENAEATRRLAQLSP